MVVKREGPAAACSLKHSTIGHTCCCCCFQTAWSNSSLCGCDKARTRFRPSVSVAAAASLFAYHRPRFTCSYSAKNRLTFRVTNHLVPLHSSAFWFLILCFIHSYSLLSVCCMRPIISITAVVMTLIIVNFIQLPSNSNNFFPSTAATTLVSSPAVVVWRSLLLLLFFFFVLVFVCFIFLR